MSKCRYDLSEDCNNTDCLTCVLDKIRAEIEKLPTYDKAERWLITAYGMKQDVLEIIDKYRAETEET